jgi:hypothetical protein
LGQMAEKRRGRVVAWSTAQEHARRRNHLDGQGGAALLHWFGYDLLLR